MKHSVLLGAILVLALLISACGPAVTQAPAQPTGVSVMESPVVTEPPAATEPSVATASPAVSATETQSGTGTQSATGTTATAATPEAAIPVTGQVVVKAVPNFDYGPILADGDGLALYIYNQDPQNGDTSACTDEECTTEWPPLTTEGTASAGPGVIQSLLGTITREDGTTQVTYNGWPLYHFNGDTGPDSTNGQGAEPGWTLISPAGKAIQPK